MNTSGCQRAETLAGAIALNEATDAERNEYRLHISSCRKCLDALGGEREIERVVSVIHHARESETWEPAVVSLQRRQKASRIRMLRFGVSAVLVAIVASLGIHVLVAASFGSGVTPPSEPAAVSYDPTRVTLEQRPLNARQPQQHAAPMLPKQKVEPPRLIVVHNVINLKSPIVSRTTPRVEAPPVSKRTTVVTVASAPTAIPVAKSALNTSNVPIWRRHEALPKHANAAPSYAVAATSAPVFEQREESMAVAPSNIVRDVVPVGGETAISPQPPSIAYAEGADGTTVFEVTVDERGTPTKCTITKSSGFLVLDDAVCKAAMKVRYQPRLVNGRPTLGIYRDAFTFHSNTDTDGLPPNNL